jgi:hypothetical protein
MLTVKDIIQRYVKQISREIKIDSIISIGDNLYKINTCNTKWAMVGYFAQVRVIDPETNEFAYIDAEIKEVKLNEYFVIEHTESPQLGIRMCELHFRSGTILQTREEIKNDDNRNDPIKRTPMIFVREVAGEQWATKYNDSIERRTLEIPEIFFLAALKSPTETTNEAYEDVIYPMLNVVRLFENVLYNFKGEVSRFQTIDIEYHTKFAVQTRVGSTEWVFDEALAGLQTQFNIALLKNFETDCKCEEIDEPIPSATILLKVNTENFKTISESPYNLTIRNSLGQSVGVIDPTNNLVIVPDAVAEINGIEVLTISSGNTLEIKVKQGGVEVGSLIGGEWIIPDCADASYRVQYVNGTLIEEGTIASGGSKTINVPNPSICDPASYEVRDADGNVLYSGTIASGGSENIVVTNSTVVVRKSDNTIISSVSVLAQGSANYQVADSIITLTDTDAATLSTTNVKATDPATIVAPNGTLNVNKSDGALISGQVVKSGETKGYNVADSVVSNSDASYTANVKATDPLTLPDQQINVNSVDEGDIPSVGTIDINITDGVNPVVPTSVNITGRTVDIEVPSGSSPSGVLFKTIEPSQYTSYRTGDEGWRVQNGFFDYTPPSNPAAVAELDYTSPNFFYVLKNPLVVNGVSSTTRFVDVNGIQAFSATGNANLVVIDKLTGKMYSRNLSGGLNWNTVIDNALTYSIVVNSITYNDWHLLCQNELVSFMDGTNNINLLDTQTGITIMNYQYCYTSSTFPINTTSAIYYETKRILPIAKTTAPSMNRIYVRDASNLITAP